MLLSWFLQNYLPELKRSSNFIAQKQAVCHLSGMIIACECITKTLLII